MEEHPQARFIVDTLAKAGFVAYYAGGWVRDFLLGHPSDDIDIATNAPPGTIQALFPKTVPIGISFGIVLVIVDGRPYEVATFRNDLEYQDGRRPSKIEFTTAEEDAKRRDFTINGMFYDPLREKVLDFVGGQEDLQKQLVRAIGNPHERIAEDRLRMIRAIRLACRFHFHIDPATAKAIRDHASELFPAVAIERIVQELEKGLKNGKLCTMLIRLHEFGLLSVIFPDLRNVSLNEIEKRLEPARHFSKNIPLVAYLLELFPGINELARLDLCKFLKLPKWDQEFASFLVYAERLYTSGASVELITWAYFYAHPSSELASEIFAAHLAEPERQTFLGYREECKTALHRSIQRIRERTPLVTSKDLLDLHIAPGKMMGLLLKEAERIAINQQIEDKKQVLVLLQKTSFWPNG